MKLYIKYLILALNVSSTILLISCASNKTKENKQVQEEQSYKNPETVRLTDPDLRTFIRNVEHGQLDTLELTRLKKYLLTSFNKNLDSLRYLTIAYFRPKNLCWYDNYGWVKNGGKESYEKLKSNLNTDLLVLHYDSGYESTISQQDTQKIVYNLFDRKNYEVCDFTVTINQNGLYFYKASHFYVDMANAFKNELEIHDKR